MSRTTGFRFIVGKLMALLIGVCSFWTATARASDPIGIYALVDKVVLEPSESAPERIQIWGAFAFAVGYDFAYDKPKRGFLYYKLNPDKKDTCLKEWTDLKSVAGKKQVIGFAARHRDKGTLRKADAKPEQPDTYPLGFGVTKARDLDYEPVRELLKLEKTPDSKKDSVPPKRKESKAD